uniref:Putative secreted peptide n=1 Tax=Anopheles braziliensis TaxID=58242 RepID=A0A2M3ZQN2_9DIPT
MLLLLLVQFGATATEATTVAAATVADGRGTIAQRANPLVRTSASGSALVAQIPAATTKQYGRRGEGGRLQRAGRRYDQGRLKGHQTTGQTCPRTVARQQRRGVAVHLIAPERRSGRRSVTETVGEQQRVATVADRGRKLPAEYVAASVGEVRVAAVRVSATATVTASVTVHIYHITMRQHAAARKQHARQTPPPIVARHRHETRHEA